MFANIAGHVSLYLEVGQIIRERMFHLFAFHSLGHEGRPFFLSGVVSQRHLFFPVAYRYRRFSVFLQVALHAPVAYPERISFTDYLHIRPVASVRVDNRQEAGDTARSGSGGEVPVVLMFHRFSFGVGLVFPVRGGAEESIRQLLHGRRRAKKMSDRYASRFVLAGYADSVGILLYFHRQLYGMKQVTPLHVFLTLQFVVDEEYTRCTELNDVAAEQIHSILVPSVFRRVACSGKLSPFQPERRSNFPVSIGSIAHHIRNLFSFVSAGNPSITFRSYLLCHPVGQNAVMS